MIFRGALCGHVNGIVEQHERHRVACLQGGRGKKMNGSAARVGSVPMWWKLQNA